LGADGIRVVDLSIAMSGPIAAMRLGDLGGHVVKVEPIDGEWQRHNPAAGAVGKEVNASFLALNRNKRSLAVNLKSQQGGAIVLQLTARSDVFVQNYRPGVAVRLGVDYNPVRSVNSSIVYASICGYGEDGPYAPRSTQGLLFQAISGAMFNVGRASDPPVPPGTYIVDAITAYSAVEGVLAALVHRARTGEGQMVSVNMLDAAIDGYLAMAMPNLKVLAELLDTSELAAMDGRVDGPILVRQRGGYPTREPRCDHFDRTAGTTQADHGRLARRFQFERHLGGPRLRLPRATGRSSGAA
jgi:crotonobetainyl-CoA:carnitine CoA-transferase CaiB-like acyl-CoA transferase